MKKLLLSLFVCLCAFTAMANMPINIGFHGGYSINNMKFKDLPNASSKSSSGYMVGAFMRVNLGKLYLEPALNYSHKKSEGESLSEMFDLEMNTFDIPLMLGVYVLDLPLFKLRAFAGPQISIGKLKDVEKFVGIEDAKKANWSGKVGAGIDIWKLTLDMDFQKGFKELANEVKAPSSFNFTLGFKIL